MMLIIENRKNLSRPLFVTSLSFFVLPIVTTIVQILHYGLALQAIAITISIQFTFVVDTIEMNKKIRSQDDAYQKASYEAQHDGLTDLWSKSAGREQIENYFAHMQEGDQAVLIFVDIDDFKQIFVDWSDSSQGQFTEEQLEQYLRYHENSMTPLAAGRDVGCCIYDTTNVTVSLLIFSIFLLMLIRLL